MNLSEYSVNDLVMELVRRRAIDPCQAKKIMAGPREARIKLSQADEWIRKYPDSFQSMLNAALSLAEKGKKFGGRLLSEEMRWGENSSPIVDQLVPYVVFRMVQKHPSLRDKITLKIRVPKEESRGIPRPS